MVPFFCAQASPHTAINWNFTTTPQVNALSCRLPRNLYHLLQQTGLKNRIIEYPRGRLLGGSSSINIMIYTRGSSEEYDRIAKVTGDQSWSYKNILPYINKVRPNSHYGAGPKTMNSTRSGCLLVMDTILLGSMTPSITTRTEKFKSPYLTTQPLLMKES
jgi:choline dehydrogenase-like flavoprotein